MSDEPLGAIEVSHHYDATPERVFDAFLNVDVARHFLFATKTGEMITAEIDPRVGGKFIFTERRPDMGDVLHTGEYLEIDRPRRLVFTFGVPQFDPRMTTVTIEIEPVGAGAVLRLSCNGIPPDFTDRTRHGWSVILAGLSPAYEGEHGAGW